MDHFVATPGVYVSDAVADGATPGVRRALFLDRDGVINLNHGYVHTPGQTDWVPGIFDFCRRARHAGFECVVVTNQAGIARGYYSEAQFLGYTRWVHEQFQLQGVPLLATFYCPHHPTAGVGSWLTDCECRKPKPGMILAACRLLGLTAQSAVMVGDQSSDLEAAAAAGVQTAVLIDANRKRPFDEAVAILGF